MEFQKFDADYVRRLVEGDRLVGEHFSSYFGELLCLKLRRRVRSRESMEEIRQRTFVRVLQALRQKGALEHPERLGAFVWRVCENVQLEKVREETAYIPLNKEAEAWPDKRVDLDAMLIDQERKRLVETVLADLRNRDQELLRMILFDRANNGEACRRLRVSQEHLRVLLHRAISRFRRKLAKRRPATASIFILQEL